ncbi:carbohydrate ABC transporter permease [Falsirhodobacter sp. 20TX0035]|uniref:carbohydrate ABC transporter permease n=1 Tax=Falsirhodobacter sp. 20TX0035 TaxID=3022019 RepID=UPI00232AD954|nr:sugar ABC transporter permease [Falsirhodobacter sp. 20TX0035]MDB6453747.1 sugar ABC transporter permease [Falsirhodobacter sp. 20TX0035]
MAMNPLNAVGRWTVDWTNPPMRWLQARVGVRRMAFLFLLPNFLALAIFVFLPMLLNGVYAVTDGNRVLPTERAFVGLQHFRTLFSCTNYLDPATCAPEVFFFWRGLYNTVFFVVIEVVCMVGFSLATALVLNRLVRAQGFWRAVFFYPVMLSPVVVALIWKWILDRQGLLNGTLDRLGLDGLPWLLDAHWAMFWSIFIYVWAHAGFYTLIILAGLQAIPKDLYEAASLESDRPFTNGRIFRKVTLPLLMPTLLSVSVIAVTKAFQVFDEVWVLTRGGPGTATTFVLQSIYETGFTTAPREYGLAAAMSILLALIIFLLTGLQLVLSNRRMEDR